MRLELIDVLSREKFDRYVTIDRRRLFMDRYFSLAAPVYPMEAVTDCVDPKDNMILECALGGQADVILTGDDHLLRLHPRRDISILKPVRYLALNVANDLL